MNSTDTAHSPTGAGVESAFVEHVFPWEKKGSYGRGDPFAKVWCYFVEGKPESLTGSFRAIEQYIAEHCRPCLAHVFFGRYDRSNLAHLPIREARYSSLRRGYWRFYNVGNTAEAYNHGTHLRVSERKPQSTFASSRRLGCNDHFAIEHVENTKVVKCVKYRQLPKAFPKDFLYVVKGDTVDAVQ